MSPEPRATYRLQLHGGFGFAEATAVLPYLAELGVSHVYVSPCLQAVAGSTHGYDVVNPTRVNEELGGPEAHARFCRELRRLGLGQLLDIVPNHMAIAGRQNPWWWDVLENGPSSRYAAFFDVDWATTEERWRDKVLLPVLGDHYGRVLEAGELALAHVRGVFTLHYFEHAFPIDPSSLDDLLGRVAAAVSSDHLAFLADSCARLPRPTVTSEPAVERRHRDKAVLASLLARLCDEEPGIAEAIDAEATRLNGDANALDALIDRQNYRLAYWRAASRDLGYRRFFDVNTLVGMRVEDEAVFRATHALPLAWVRGGDVQGLRVDHPDGLRDPAQYFRRLAEACPDVWIVAEKILAKGEALPADWPVGGTTGYDFLNEAAGLFVDAEAEELFTAFYAEYTGESPDFPALVRACKRQVLDELLASDLRRLAALFVDICEGYKQFA